MDISAAFANLSELMIAWRKAQGEGSFQRKSRQPRKAEELRQEALEACCDIAGWLDKGGFPPRGFDRAQAAAYLSSCLARLSR